MSTHALEYLSEGVDLPEECNLKCLIEDLQIHLDKAPSEYKNSVEMFFHRG